MIWGFGRKREAPSVVVHTPREKPIEQIFEPSPPQEAPKQGNEDTLEGVITDQRLLQWFFKTFKGADVHPIATDQFLNKSKDQYTAPWLTRELVQNFIDHNPKAPGTLDDVQFHKQVLPDGTTRFIIQGKWKFPDPTGVLSPHSDKPADFNTAGGNGIGLKQSAIRFLRDFGVTRFEIRGEKWQVTYHLAKRDTINHEMHAEAAKRKLSPVAQVKHDWLVGDVRQTEETGVNTYVLETQNKEMIAALESFPNIGVSSSNEFLRDPDFKNKHGTIKWLLPEKGKLKRGRLFINGQVMHWGRVGEKTDDYWTGPVGLTLQLNNISYKMSIDRPPVNKWDLRTYIHEFINSMSTKELVAQLQCSEPLWIRDSDKKELSFDDAVDTVVHEMVNQLAARNFSGRNFAAAFSKKKYLVLDIELNMWNRRSLQKQGYVFCPKYFSNIGVPLASTVLQALDGTAGVKPDAEKIMKKQSEIAESVGMRVGAPEFSIQKPEDMLGLIRRYLTPRSQDMHVTENALHIVSQTQCPKELFLHDLMSPRKYSDNQELLYLARGIIKAGLTSKALRAASITAGEYKQTYDTAQDKITNQTLLFARSTKQKPRKGTEIRFEFNPAFFELFKPLLEAKRTQVDQGSAVIQGPGEPLPEGVFGTVTSQGESEEFGHAPARPVSHGHAEGASDSPPSGGTSSGAPGVSGGKPRRPVRVIEGPSDMLDPETDDEPVTVQRRGSVQPSEPAPEEQLFEPETVVRPVKKVAFPKEVKATQLYTGEQPDHGVIDTTSTLPPEEAKRLEELKKQLPALDAALKTLDAAIPHVTSVKKPEKIIEDYIAARRSPDFKKNIVEGVGYVDGRHLTEILLEGTQAKIPDVRDMRTKTPEEHLRAELSEKLKALAIRAAGDGDEDDMNIDMVLNPKQEHLAQLALLRQYIVLTTSPAFANDLFVFRGAKTKGINIARRAIGVHEAVFETSFEEALAVMVHELAHNEPEAMGHDYRFMHTMQTLFVFSEKAIYEIAAKRDRGEKLSNRETVVLDMRNQWEKLRQAN